MSCHIIHVSILLSSGLLRIGAQNDARKPPTILEPFERRELIIRKGLPVNLLCRAEGIPDVSYEWLRNDGSILSTNISVNDVTGTLLIPAITEEEEGFFNCRAKNVYQEGQEAVAVSPKIEVRVARVGKFLLRASPLQYVFTEGGYAKLPCDEKLPEYYGQTFMTWYKAAKGTVQQVITSERVFVDREGALHFAYLIMDDENTEGNRTYQCGLSNHLADLVSLGSPIQVQIRRLGAQIPAKKPVLKYSTHGNLLTVKRNSSAYLECFFSGYENEAWKVPNVSWYNNKNQKITEGGRYKLRSDGYVLIIMNVMESDESNYTCEGSSGLGSARGHLYLNVTSSPIWVVPMKPATAVQGTNAELTCLARSAVAELLPEPPVWYKNGNKMGNEINPTKYKWSQDKTRLTVTLVLKDRDIACFQCDVKNSVGTSSGQTCLNVILPITVVAQPKSELQIITKGELVDLTVLAVSDPLTPVTYRWIYNNVSYEQYEAPPYVTYDAANNEAYIKTSSLTDEEYESIGGLYRREIYHEYQSVFVDVTVVKKKDAQLAVVLRAVFVPLAILLLPLVVFGGILCRRKYKNREETRQIETAARITQESPEDQILNDSGNDLRPTSMPHVQSSVDEVDDVEPAGLPSTYSAGSSTSLAESDVDDMEVVKVSFP